MKQIPHFIYEKKNQITMVIFVPLFILAFFIAYQPFNFDYIDTSFFTRMGASPSLAKNITLVCIIFIGLAVIAASRILMGFYARKKPFTYRSYIIWVVCEILTMVLIYAIIQYTSFDPSGNFSDTFRQMLIKTILVLLIPYVMSYVYFIWQDKARELRAIRKKLEEDENALKKAYIQIFDEHDEMRLSIRRENLVLIESADNYVNVWYLNNDRIKKVLVRNTLTRIENQLENTNVKRCHRSYIVNLEHIKVLSREKEGVFIEMGIEGVPEIPISKRYSQSISDWIIKS